jgi:hypothetical protein
MATKSTCICEVDQSGVCGFDYIDHQRTHDCDYPPPVHTGKKTNVCKIVTKEFPLQRTTNVLLGDNNTLTLVVKYAVENQQTFIKSIQLKSRDPVSNNTHWHTLSIDDLQACIQTMSMIKNGIASEDEVFLF